MYNSKSDDAVIRKLSELYKGMVTQEGPDGTPGFNNKYSVDDFYNTVSKHLDEFRDGVLKHPFFEGRDYKTLNDVYEGDLSLLIYCFQTFFNEKMYGSIVSTEVTGQTIEVNPETMEPIHTEEEKNKKEFVKEVLNGVPRKTTLKEFLTDPRSYKQFRNQVDECMFYIDWEKIHRVMKKLKWKWMRWEDELGDVHKGTVPSVYGIKGHVYDMIQGMEDWILEHGDMDHYLSGTGGFEYEMWVCEPADPDDFDNRVRFVVRFVVEQFDTGM